jgi:hypothetical protein
MKILRDSSACLFFFFWFQLSLLPIDVVVAEDGSEEDCNQPVLPEKTCYQLNDVGGCRDENDFCGMICAFNGGDREMTCQNDTNGDLVCRTKQCNLTLGVNIINDENEDDEEETMYKLELELRLLAFSLVDYLKKENQACSSVNSDADQALSKANDTLTDILGLQCGKIERFQSPSVYRIKVFDLDEHRDILAPNYKADPSGHTEYDCASVKNETEAKMEDPDRMAECPSKDDTLIAARSEAINETEKELLKDHVSDFIYKTTGYKQECLFFNESFSTLFFLFPSSTNQSKYFNTAVSAAFARKYQRISFVDNATDTEYKHLNISTICSCESIDTTNDLHECISDNQDDDKETYKIFV